MLLLAARFVDDAFEDATHGLALERLATGGHQSLEDLAFALGIVDAQAAFALELADLQHELQPLSQQIQDLFVDAIDRVAQLGQIERAHGERVYIKVRRGDNSPKPRERLQRT